MLTGRLPFNTSSVSSLLKSQREGMSLSPTNLRLDLPQIADTIFERAMAFSPSERYPKARDFGDAFYNALNTAVSSEKDEKLQTAERIDILPNIKVEENIRKAINQTEELELPELPVRAVSNVEDEIFQLELPPTKSDSVISPVVSSAPADAENFVESEVKTPKHLTFEKRSLEPPVAASSNKTLLSILGIATLLIGIFAVWYYVLNQPNTNPVAPAVTENVNTVVQNTEVAPPANLNAEVKSSPAVENIEAPPPVPANSQPPNTVFFENSKENLKGALLRHFVGFSVSYPQDWTKNNARNNFLDVAKKSTDGKPVEQFLVSYYDSWGTFKMDEKIFPKLAEKSNKDLAKIIPNYQTMSTGETKVNGDLRAYEVKFQGGGKVENGEKNLIIWGRRLWIPADRPGTKNGYVVTMLATSLSPEINSVDDVGAKGDLGTVFKTFKPNQNF